MLRPDQAFELKSTRHETLSDDEELVYEELVRKKHNERPKLEDFFDESKGDLYNEAIKKDLVKAETVKNNFNVYSTQKSEIFEAVLTEEIEKSEWLDDAYTSRTTIFDDEFNHTDFIIEWNIENNAAPIRLAVDVTADDHISGIIKKYEKIKKEFDNNRGTTIEYLSSASGENLRKVKDLPSVVIAIDKPNLNKLCESVARRLRREPGSNKSLAENNIKFQLQEEIISQLEIQKKYFEEENIDYKKLPIYKNIINTLNFLNKITENKNARINNIKNGQNVKLSSVKPTWF